MRRWIVGMSAGLLLACGTFGQEGQQAVPPRKAASKQAVGAASTGDKEDLNLLLEGNIRAMWIAYRDRKKSTYADYLWDDYKAVEEDGDGERDKMHVMRELDDNNVQDSKPQWFVFEKLGPETMLVTYENFITFPPKSARRFEKLFISEIWVKRNGQWKAWRYQATPVK